MFAYWLKKNWYYHRSLQAMYQRFVEPKKRVLQVACRNGYLLHAVQAESGYGVGIDEDPAHIQQARETYPDYQFHVGSIESFVSDQTFDYIILSAVVRETYDIQKLFASLRRFSHAGTRIIIDNYSSLWEPVLWITQKLGLRRPTEFKHWVSRADIEDLLYLTDYEVVVQGRFMLMPVYIPFVATFLNRIVAHIPGINWLCLNQYVVARLKPEKNLTTQHKVSVVIPCKNERGNIEDAVVRTPHMGAQTELIFVEGGSTDGTFEEIQRVIKAYPEKNIRCFKQEGKYKIGAVHTGFKHATGDVFMILDADLTVPPEELPTFLTALLEGKGELINGSRLVYGMEPGAMRVVAVMANWIFSTLMTFVLKQPIKDSLCGTKVLLKKDYKRIRNATHTLSAVDPFGDFELLFGAAALNLVIRDVPVHYKSRSYGKSQISHVTDGFTLLYMVMLGFRKLRSY